MQAKGLDWLITELHTLAEQLGGGPAGAAPLVVAIDQGGHATRAIAFDLAGVQSAEAFAPISTTRGPDGRVEHDPEEVLASAQAVLEDLCETLGDAASRVVACGLATQRSSMVCWDRMSGEALSPVLSWQDRRNAEWLESLRPRAGEIRAITGLVLSAHYGASKMRWCLDHVAPVREAQRRGRLVMGPLASFLLARLITDGPTVADPANASRTQLWDTTTRDWSPVLLEIFGIPLECLPASVPSRYEFGSVRFGDRAIPLLVATGDQNAAMFAVGRPACDVVQLNAGTGAFLLCALPGEPPLETPLLRSVLWSDEAGVTYALEGTINGAGSALDWLDGQIGLDPHRAARALDRVRVSQLDVPLFLNAISGVGSPYWIPAGRSGFVGRGDELGQVAAILESIAFLARANVDAIRNVNPAVSLIRATGGLAESNYLCEAIADLTSLRVERRAIREATASGLAFLVAGEPGGWQAPGVVRVFEPATDAALLERYVRWRRAMRDVTGP
jgi:glycerol kinase